MMSTNVSGGRRPTWGIILVDFADIDSLLLGENVVAPRMRETTRPLIMVTKVLEARRCLSGVRRDIPPWILDVICQDILTRWRRL